MDLAFDTALADGYRSSSQQVRRMSEDWVKRNVYCPRCGRPVLTQYPNNRPAADFFCEDCRTDFELKSHRAPPAAVIPDGAYSTMLERIESSNNPSLFVLDYKGTEVTDLLVVPGYFFTAAVIEKRNPLAPTARRAGWTGCNIRIRDLPDFSRIYLIRDGVCMPKAEVVQKFQRTLAVETTRPESRGWMLDVLKCVERIPERDFSLQQVYAFEAELQAAHPENHFVRDKIRQQLQLLRDRGLLEFTSRGHYRRLF